MAAALSSGLGNLSLDEDYLIVAAIDFGTTFSGYAFSFRTKQYDIKMNKNWGSEVGCDSYKAPTCVMTKPGGEFHSFGYAAENNYNQLDPDEDKIGGQDGYNLYRHFKMLLHNQGAKLSSTVTSTTGHVTKAIDIFAMALKYLKEHMMAPIKKALRSPPKDSDIRWVITVPAIWTDESKGFMREAAFRAGLISELESKKLLIALEPEAASVFCRLYEESFEDEDIKFKTGDRMLVIDAGGGTVDISAHELLISGDVKEIAPPSGGSWGGIKIDEKFESVLRKNLGSDFINAFKVKHPQQWLTLMLHFEKAKKSAKPDGMSSVRVAIPHSFDPELVQLSGQNIGETLKKKKGEILFNNGYLVFKHEAVKQLFAEVTVNIVDHVKALLKDRNLQEVKHILLVGGFGECSFLQHTCQQAFADAFLIPIEPQLAIIKGAVIYGHNPLQISSRIAKYTYGCKMYDDFDENIHDPSKKFTKQDGSVSCIDLFETFIKAGSEIKTASSETFKFRPVNADNTTWDITIYKTLQESVTYIDEKGVDKIGCITLRSPSGPLGNELELRVTFGHTELLIEARDVTRGEQYPVKTTVDFLSD